VVPENGISGVDGELQPATKTASARVATVLIIRWFGNIVASCAPLGRYHFPAL